MRWKGNCGVEGNERADRLAAQGSDLRQSGTPWSYDTAKGVIRRKTRPLRTHDEDRNWIYGIKQGITTIPRDRDLTRKQQVEITRFRTGHHPDLGTWRVKMGLKEEGTDECRLCGIAKETSQHIVEQCPALNNYRDSELSVIVSESKRLIGQTP